MNMEDKDSSESDEMEKEKNGAPSSGSPHFKFRGILAQIAASFSKYLIMLDIGMGICYPTIAIPPILNATEGLSITQEQASWFASLVFIWQPVGSLASVPMTGLGRKRMMFFLQIPIFIGWLMPYFATTVWELYAASTFLGLGIGFMQAPIAAYIGEVCQPQYRGWLASIAYCFLTLGNVVVYAIDVIVGNWRVTALYCGIMPPLTAVVLFMIPESPVWLVSEKRYDDAKRSLKWLRGWVSDEAVEVEYRQLLYNNCKHFASLCEAENGGPKELPLQIVEEEYRSKPNGKNPEEMADIQNGATVQPLESDKSFLKYLLEPEMYKPIILSLVFFYLSNGIAVAVFRSYLILIFRHFKIEMDNYVVLVGVTCIGLMGNIVCVIIMPLIGKRKLTFTAGILCTLGVFGLGMYTIFMDQINRNWIPIVLMVELFFATNLGIGHIPWILISEIFPLRGRTFASGLVAGLANFMQFLGTKLFWTYVSWFTLGGTFIMYTIVFIIGLTYLYFFQIETEGRPLESIITNFKLGGKAINSPGKEKK